MAELWTEMHGVDEREQRPARVGGGDDGVGRNLIAVVEDDAACGIISNDNLRDGRVGADVGSRFAGGGGQGVADGAGAAASHPARRHRLVMARRHQQKDRGASRGARAEV